MPGGIDPAARDALAFTDRGEVRFLVLLGGLVAHVHVRHAEAEELVCAARRAKHCVLARARRAGQPQGQAAAAGVDHLAGDRAHPDQLVQRLLVAAELAAHLLRGAEAGAGGPDRLVRLLRVLHLVGVRAGRGREVGLAEPLDDLGPGRRDGLLGQRHRIGTHVRDVPTLVEALGHRHRPGRTEAELVPALLLERRGLERCLRAFGERLRLRGGHRVRGVAEPRRERARIFLVEVDGLGPGRERAGGGVEVTAGCESLAVELDEPCVEVRAACREPAVEIPVRRRVECHPLAFALDHEPGGDTLHAAGRAGAADAPPEHGRDLVAHEPVEDAPTFLRLDELHVQLARIRDGFLDGLLGDLVEHHAFDREARLRLQHLEEMPRDRLALAILIRREVELVGILERLAQAADHLRLVRRDLVLRLEVVVHVDREALAGQVTDVAHAGHDRVVATEEATDRVGFGLGFDDDEGLGHGARFRLDDGATVAPGT